MDNEVIKHAKLCYTKGKDGLVKGQLCYGLIMPSGGCTIDANTISTSLTSAHMNHSISALGNVDKVIISYDYSRYKVNID